MVEDPVLPEDVPLVRARTAAAAVITSLKKSTDESAMRMKQDDHLNELLELVLQRKAEMARERE